jgi:Protein of unknown function (DUF2009)
MQAFNIILVVAGSCIDGRLTSAWNWCSQIEKKPYYHIFKVAGACFTALAAGNIRGAVHVAVADSSVNKPWHECCNAAQHSVLGGTGFYSFDGDLGK